jgi:hemolysin activation/secretion protein
MRWIAASLSFVFLVAAASAKAESAADEVEEDAPKPVFDILEYRIEGNTVLPAIDVERAVYPYLGPGRTIDDVQAAAQALEKTYQTSGYLTVLVGIPEQKVTEGAVVLQVTEGKLDRLRVQGPRYYSAGHIRALAPSLKEGEVPYFPDVQKDLALLNRPADRKVAPVLKPAMVPGSVDIDLKVDDKLPLHGSVELNNRYTANTEPLRLSAAVRYDNLWQRQHSASVQVLTSPQDTSQVRVISGNYVFNPGGRDNILALYAVRSDTDVATPSASIVGRGTITGARYIVPLPARGDIGHSVTLGADYKDFKESERRFAAESLLPPISYVPLSGGYTAQKRGRKGVTTLNLGTTFGMRDFFGNRDDEFAARRFGAHANFFVVRADAQRDQNLGRGYTLLIRVGGQTASGPLVNTEQYFAGGVDTVRGYLEAETLGDDALAARVELKSPSIARYAGSAVNELNAIAFVDAAEVRVQQPLFPIPGRTRLSSAGLGLRAKGPSNLAASVDLAWPFESTPRTTAGDMRVHFRVAYDF